MNNSFFKRINTKESIEFTKDELYFFETYVGNITLMNYIHSSSIQQYKIYPFRSKPIDFISQHDSYHKLIKQRVDAVSALDSRYSALL